MDCSTNTRSSPRSQFLFRVQVSALVPGRGSFVLVCQCRWPPVMARGRFQNASPTPNNIMKITLAKRTQQPGGLGTTEIRHDAPPTPPRLAQGGPERVPPDAASVGALHRSSPALQSLAGRRRTPTAQRPAFSSGRGAPERASLSRDRGADTSPSSEAGGSRREQKISSAGAASESSYRRAVVFSLFF